MRETLVTDRKFAAFHKPAPAFRMETVPAGGLCLSSFVVLSKFGQREQILMGRLDPSAPWDHIGALDQERAMRHSNGWMLPSSHLLLRESPQDAARRVLREQLGLNDQSLDGPVVVSETYQSIYSTEDHWDFEFIFTGQRREEVPRTNAWRELRFVDVARIRPEEIARSHGDILAHLGRLPRMA